MNIFIQGRKDGYNVLYPKPTPTEFFQFASDIQRIDAPNLSHYYGKSFYSIAFNGSGCIFSKFIIGYDVQRSNLGNIGISVFVPSAQKLAGVDVRTLLDELANTYCTNYCHDFYINNSKQEDWLLFTSAANNFDAKLCDVPSDDVEYYQQGAKDAAFVLYESDAELQKYFDVPYQEEYRDFKQILFLENNSQDLLNVVKYDTNANLTGKIDLENPYYKLREYHSSGKNGVSIEIRANGKLRSNKDKIYRKDNVTIKYSKNYFIDICETGKLIDENITKYLIIDENAGKIDVKKDIELKPVEKTINIKITDRKGNPVNDAEITYKSGYQQEQTTTSNTITFNGEELKERWTISAKQNDNLYSKEVTITPENQIEDVTLVLEEHRKVKILANDKENGDIIYGFKVHVTGANIYEVVNEIDFVGEDIEKTWNIQVEKRNEYEDSENKLFCPAKDGNEINFKLTKCKSKQTKYLIDVGTHGKRIEGKGSDFVYSKGDADPKWIKPKKGYKCTKFELDENRKEEGFDGVLVAQYEKNKSFIANLLANPELLAVSLIAVIAIVVMAVMFWNDIFSGQSPKMQQQTISEKQITSYVEGDYLILDTLKSYKANWEKQKPEIKKEGGGIFGGGEEKTDSTKYKEWDETLQSIKQAINKRNLIDKKDFAELKKQDFSKQFAFQTAIEKIDNTKYAEVREKLGDVSSFTLTQIADSINSILTPKEPVKTEQPQEVKKENSTKPAETKQNTPTETQISTQPKAETQSQSATTDKTSEIIQYIKGSELDEAKLQEYKNTKGINQNLKNSIQLCLDFWVLDGSGSGKKSKTYWTFRDKVNADNNFSNSKVKAFLDKMCQEGANPSYSKQDKKKGLK